jgi:general secretion pathway protein H
MNPPAPLPRGFTLIEILIVLAIVAIGAGAVSLALRDTRSLQLEREATRLSALLESARAHSRASGLPVVWVPAGGDGGGKHFQFTGLNKSISMPGEWLDERTRAEVVGAKALILGPEPILPAQRIVLRLEDQNLSISTDGLGPFQITEPGQHQSSQPFDTPRGMSPTPSR